MVVSKEPPPLLSRKSASQPLGANWAATDTPVGLSPPKRVMMCVDRCQIVIRVARAEIGLILIFPLNIGNICMCHGGCYGSVLRFSVKLRICDHSEKGDSAMFMMSLALSPNWRALIFFFPFFKDDDGCDHDGICTRLCMKVPINLGKLSWKLESQLNNSCVKRRSYQLKSLCFCYNSIDPLLLTSSCSSRSISPRGLSQGTSLPTSICSIHALSRVSPAGSSQGTRIHVPHLLITKKLGPVLLHTITKCMSYPCLCFRTMQRTNWTA